MVTALPVLRSHLHRLSELARLANPDGHQLQAEFLAAQQHFQHQVMPLAEPYPSGQPMLTEMNRTLRLLAMDVTFLLAARQPTTAQQRQRQMGDKLTQLLGFCEALEQAIAAAAPDP
ncbi:MAG TPA: heterocyst frequency control protein PatD [Nodosilinea sp.]|nr:heterocyst frequency control protein PatD [Nodosilinea sp.]